ncbi:hypothetical protein BGZ65_010037, partial [Modicella reniformis]
MVYFDSRQEARQAFFDAKQDHLPKQQEWGVIFPMWVRVVQFKCPDTITTLVQRLGRAARDPRLQGI